MSKLTDNMNRLGKQYAKYREAEKVRQQARNYDYEVNQQHKKTEQAIKDNRELQKRLSNNKAGKAIAGFVYGFNTGMAPLSYSKKAADLGYKAYTPTAAAAEKGDTSKKTAEFNKALESSGAYKKAHMAGNVAATALYFLMGSGATKAAANKALSTSAAKTAIKTSSENLANIALRKGVKKNLTRKVLERSAQNMGRKVDEAAVKAAANRMSQKVAKNVAQDVAGDVSIGLYRDLAQAREQGVDIKNIKELVPYLGKQAAFNTAIGAVTNGAGPALGALKRNKRLWKTVEKKVTDAAGRTHIRYEKVLKTPGRGNTVRNVVGDANDIVSTRIRKGQKFNNKVSPETLKNKAVSNAVNDAYYVDQIRKHGIDGMSVKDYAKKHNKSVMDVIAEDYQKRNGVQLENMRRIRESVTNRKNADDVVAELTGNNKIGATRAVNRSKLRSAFETANPNSRKYTVRNTEGRRIAHRLTQDDVMKANYIAVEGAPNIKAQRQAALTARRDAANALEGIESRSERIKSTYIPTNDINDIRLARKLQERNVLKFAKRDLGTDDLVEYARENGLEPQYVYNMEKDKLAGQLGARKLSVEEQDVFRNAPDEIMERAAKAKSAKRATRYNNQNVQSTARQTTQTADNAAQTTNTATRQAGYTAPDETVRTQNGTPISVESVNGTKGRQAAEEGAFRPDTEGAPDATMGGQRSGSATHRSDAADSVAYMAGNTPRQTKEINDYLNEINADKTFSMSNDEAMEEAARRINRDNLDGARAALRQKFDSNTRFDNVDISEGFTAMNRLDELEDAALKRGDTAMAESYAKSRDEIAGVLSIEASETGKTLQAMKQFHKMTPQGRVNSALMMKAKIARQTGVKNLKIDQDYLDMLYSAKSVKDMQMIQDAIRKQVWDQVPSTLTEKCAAWRYLSMLGNPKTHIRNVMGNLIFVPTRAVKNILGTGIEKLGVAQGYRTKAILNPFSKADHNLINKGIQEWDKVKDDFLNGTAKYDLGLRRPEGSKVFKNRLINRANELNSWALNAEDEVFAKFAYTHAFAQYMKANKITLANASDEVLEAARKQAWDEALTATYRESNALADLINQGRKYAAITSRDINNAVGSQRNKLIMEKVGGVAVDAMIPFAKTPANILASGVKYSPVGLIRGAGKLLTAKNAQDVVKGIDALSEGITGTGMFALGAYFAHKGWANASIDKDDQGYYDFDRGKQEYAINIGNNTLKKMDWFDLLNSDRGNDVSVTMDWAVPDAMSFFSGVELGASMLGGTEDEDITDKATKAGKFFTNMLKMSDPVLEMSMLSSLKNAFDNSKADENGNSPVLQTATNIVQSRLGQYVPTVAGQITKTIEPNQKSSTSVQTGAVKSWDSFLKQQMNKIPGLTKLNPDKTNAFGQKKEHKENLKNYGQALLKNMFSPANIKQVRNSGVDTELQRLVNEDGQSAADVLPRTAYKGQMDTSFKDLEFKIGAHEVEQFNQYRGKAALNNLKKLFKSEEYENASPEDKTKLIKNAYNEATETAKKKFAGDQGVTGYEYDYGTLSDSARKKYNEKLSELKEKGSPMKKKAYMKIFKKTYGYGSERPDAWDSGKYVAKTLLATEIKDGVRDFTQAEITTSANKTTWEKVVNLHDAGIKSKQALKYVITDDEKDRCSVEDRNGNKKLDEGKLTLFINSMDIPQKEKWARFEVNRYKNFRNPFTF